MRTAIKSIFGRGPARPSNVVFAVCAGVMALTLLIATGTAKAQDAAGSAATASKPSMTANEVGQKGQNPDGWINCNSLKSKSAYHDVTFNNCNGSYPLTVTRTGDTCMYGAGNYQINVPVGTAYQINLEDKNSGFDCYQGEKNVTWSIQAHGGPTSQAEWRHAYTNQDGYSGITQWMSRVDDTSTGAGGLVSGATCDGANCFNQWAQANTGRPQVVISFE